MWTNYYANEYGTNYNAKLENILSAHCKPMWIDLHIASMVKTSKPIAYKYSKYI